MLIQVGSVPNSELIAFLSSCQQAIDSTLTKAAGIEDAEGLTAAQIKQVIRCALLVVRLAKRVTPDGNITAVWRPEAVSSLLTRFEQNARFKSSSAVIGMCKQLLSTVSSTPKAEKLKKTERTVTQEESRPVVGDHAGEKKFKGKKRKADRPEGETTLLTQKKMKK